jgi:hypothetical protein
MDLFLHIPKTAGLTLMTIARRQYEHCRSVHLGNEALVTRFLSSSQEFRDHYQFVGGHFGYGFDRHFTKPCRYVTMLRDPVDVLVSLYHYILRREDHPHHVAMAEGHVSFVDWLSGNWLDHYDDYQLRCLIGRLDPRPLSDDDLRFGKDVLAGKMAAFGMTERFDESLRLIEIGRASCRERVS